MSGMVKVPVVIMLATDLPETVPSKPLETIADLAGPPWDEPVRANARSIKNYPAPVLLRKAPNKMNK